MAGALSLPADGADDAPVLHGAKLLIAAILLGMTNFIAVLDLTITNVSIPHIAGSLAVSPAQGTWAITGYAVAEAITVPLTGWLALRFGILRTFIATIIGFGFFSVLCGISQTIEMLVIARIGQGLLGGPMMPLSQALLLRIFPREKANTATAIWAMTTVIAPVAGPLLGGYISDNWAWQWIFLINIPFCLVAAWGVGVMLRHVETPTEKRKIDGMGLALLVLWVGAFQVMLEQGREHDWFNTPFIVALGLIAALGFVVFIIWELTQDHPIVDVRVFRYRSFTISTLVLALGFAAFFCTMVLVPQWLQLNMGYTAQWAGYATAGTGLMAFFMAPFAARMAPDGDRRLMISAGLIFVGGVTLMRIVWTSQADFWTVAMPQILQGFGIPFFMIGLTMLAVQGVKEEDVPTATGLMSFCRTLAAAIATSLVMTGWEHSAQESRAEMVNVLHSDQAMATAETLHMPPEAARAMMEFVIESEALTVAMNHMFVISALLFFAAGLLVWLAPRPPRPALKD